jgi:hypothetical protein
MNFIHSFFIHPFIHSSTIHKLEAALDQGFKSPVHQGFLHENRRFFKGFEITGTGDFFNLKKKTKKLKIKKMKKLMLILRTGGSLALK